MYRYATGLTGNWSAAEEVVSLTFLEAWRLQQTVTRDGGSLRPWLLGIAVNVTRNQARAARRYRAAPRQDRAPKVTAALYRAAALIPGVTMVPNATDAIGRHGVAVAQTSEGIRTELIFSKTSLKLIGERTIVASIGISTSATAIISQGFVDHIGQLPTAPKAPAPRRWAN